jgi:DNA helicase II / ATP-dependent DNA helicase PcrA
LRQREQKLTDSNTDQTNDLNKILDSCFELNNPKSFFLYAGAGSGKTRALVESMIILRKKVGQEFRLSSRKIAVITYTNAACDEIKHRIDYDYIFAVSTIHSFAWTLIQSFQKDIRAWVRNNLSNEIINLNEMQQKGREGTKAYFERAVQIVSKQNRLNDLDNIKTFMYNPNGENIGSSSLNHSEVIKIAAYFINNKPLMQKLLVSKYPFLLIDETQDTQKDLIDAFLIIQNKHSGKFCLSLFGDTMQRIYSDGKVGLEDAIPNDSNWEKPAIITNYRSPKRIVRLINKIRSDVDKHVQEARKDAPEGFVRLFLVQDNDGMNKKDIEATITKEMAEITSDAQWAEDNQQVKILTLEHHMAARRGGFSEFFEPLYQISNYKTGLLDGTLSGISFLTKQILPLVKSWRMENRFAVAQLAQTSPLISSVILKSSTSPLKELEKSNKAVLSLFSLWKDGKDPLLIDIIMNIGKLGLFNIPEVFTPIIAGKVAEEKKIFEKSTDTSDSNLEIDAWGKALSVPFSQFESYVKYISEQSSFGTHQGIKGLQFPRVMVILDDNEARGFMFSYDKLFGVKVPTSSDKKNEGESKETSKDRTRRLFYVTCSRAQSSLAVVLYTSVKNKVRESMQKLNWFEELEIIEM